MNYQVIKVNEKIQAGDLFLLKIECPFCATEALVGYPIKQCPNCCSEIYNMEINIKSSRLLVGSSRKRTRIKKKNIQYLMEIQNNSCAYCRASLQGMEYHVDHILPVSVGGTNNVYNLALTCKRCNLLAGAKVFTNVGAKACYIMSKTKNKRLGLV
jgi:5-methylcytosine-specific restriction endonuclease McrA